MIVIFPWPGLQCFALLACVLGCSPYFMTSLAHFSLSRFPRLSPRPLRPLSIGSPHSPAPPLLTSPPHLAHFPSTSSLSPHRSQWPISITVPFWVTSLEPVRPNRQSVSSPATAYRDTCIGLHPIPCSIGNGLDPLSPRSLSPSSFLRSSAVPPTLHERGLVL